MPKMQPDEVGFYIVLDKVTRDAVALLAERNKRSVREEVTHAIRRHLAAPPSVSVEVPPLADVPPPPKRKPGRPRKCDGGG